MTRLRARAPRGKRAYGAGFPETLKQEHYPDRLDHSRRSHGHLHDRRWSHGRRGLRSLRFEHFLAPSLCEGQVVVLDGLGAHRPQRIRELIKARGADLVFLPSYSPDLNPIEEAFSKIKALVRKEGARVREALVEATGRALATVTIEDAAGWFVHAGYWPQDQSL
jgi:hypothetical protein